jgi:hypothetical protein
MEDLCMAKMIPDLFPENIENDAERYFTELGRNIRMVDIKNSLRIP